VEVRDPPLTTLPFVALSLSSTLRDHTPFLMTFPDPPFPLAQSMETEVRGIFCVDASVDEDDIRYGLGNAFIEVHDLHEILIGRSSVDIMVVVSPYHDLIHHTSPNPLDIFHASPSCPLPSLPWSVVICQQLILMQYMRGVRLTVLSPHILLEGTTPPLILIVYTYRHAWKNHID